MSRVLATGLYPDPPFTNFPSSAANELQPDGLSASLDNLVDNNGAQLGPTNRVGAPDPSGWTANIAWPVFADSGPRTEERVPRIQNNAGNGSLARIKDTGQQALYGRVWVIPTQLDLGNILSSQVRNVTVWNARFALTTDITNIVNNVGAGVTIGGIVPPVTLQEMSDTIFEVTISTSGAPFVSGTIDVITSFATFEIDVTGRRVFAWQFRPQTPVSETLEFQTQIIEADDGSEDRLALRNAPRSRLQMRWRKRDDGGRGAEISNILFDWLPRLFGVPQWWEEQRLAAAITAGATTIPVNPDSADFRVGGLVILIEDEDQLFEIQEVSVVNAGVSVEIAAPGLINSYSAGVSVMPVRLCLSEPRADQRLYTTGAEDTSMTFESIDAEPIAVIAFDDQYNGIPIFSDDNVLRSRTQPRRYSQNFLRTSFGKAVFTREKADRSKISFPKNFFVSRSLSEVWKIRSWMHQLKGSQGVFWLPSFRKDFAVQATISSGSTTIDVANVGFTTFVQSRSPRSAIEIVLKDGTSFRRDVSSSTIVDATTERLGINAALGQDVQPEDIDKVMTLWLCRIADDKVQFDHEAPGEALIGFNARGVRE